MLKKIYENLKHSENTAFVICDKKYSYQELAILVRSYYHYISNSMNTDTIGIMMRNDIETYAFMTAVMLSNVGYVILNPINPIERNQQIADAAGLSFISSSVTSDGDILPSNTSFVDITQIKNEETDFLYLTPDNNATAYVLFTSGSTGIPKGVKLTKDNLEAFLESFSGLPIEFTANDHVLQMFDLTFDVSVAMLFLSLSKGATIYTTDPAKIKYLDIARILTTYPITIACLVPSVISLLRPYLPEIYLPNLRTLILTAEATTNTLLKAIKPSIPNAVIWNLYGPTEATIWCLAYQVDSNLENELYNDLISIGTGMPGVITLIIDEGTIIKEQNVKGELFVGGRQVAACYVNDPEKNKIVFSEIEYLGSKQRFYATGDIVYMNEFGNIMYCGRKDHQVKIQGYRIELNEIEYYAREITDKMAIAVAKEVDGNTQLFLFVEGYSGSDESIIDYLEQKLPKYMVPRKIYHLNQLPVNSSSKIDRKKLEASIPDTILHEV